MSQAVEHLAELTGFRDRDLLDVTLVGAFRDLLQPAGVAIYRTVGEGPQQRWITRARLKAGDITPSADPLWADPADLPTLDSHPERHRCLIDGAAMTLGDRVPALTLFPLQTDREVVGVLELETTQALGAEQLRLVSSVLRVYRNFQGLLDYSERDTLTGLLNRKTFDESFLRSTAKAPPAGVLPVGHRESRRSPVSMDAWLGVVDIDHFKSVNDRFGHLIGDEVLLLLARLMRSSFRFHDQLYRFGGEEFVVLMFTGAADHANSAFERMRANVERYAFPRVGNISVSIGFTAVRPGDTPAAAFERADKAVYFAKQNGRNQVANHGDLIERGVFADETRSGDMELF